MASSSTALLQPTTSGVGIEKINLPCRFYPVCRYSGDQCRYLHEGLQLRSDLLSKTLTHYCFLSVPFPENHTSASNVVNNNTTLLSNCFLNPQAPIFVPTFKKDFDPNDPPKSYADVVNANREKEPEQLMTWIPVDESTTLCPYMMKSGFCRYDTCSYAHGELCELCGKFCLDPLDSDQRKRHNSECIAAHEKEMEIAFSIQRSREKTCGICFDIVWEKDGREQRFGILPNCNHCFCLECIRTWRQAKQFDNKIIRACPECRTCSDFVCPSSFWVDCAEEKEKLITKYKSALSEKDCKYFKKVRIFFCRCEKVKAEKFLRFFHREVGRARSATNASTAIAYPTERRSMSESLRDHVQA